jgi:ribosomal protein S18 acetylase RimI-like enzyme
VSFDSARSGALPNGFDPEVSYEIERLAVRAWPAGEVEEVEGWLVRRTDGVDRRRSNSLLPPADPGRAARTVDVALAMAEELGWAQVVQVAPAEVHGRLDAVLEAQGMVLSGATLVLVGELAGGAARPAGMELDGLTSEWVAAWAEVSGMGGTRETAELVLSQLGDRARFAVVRDGATGRAIGTCVGVAEDGWLGLFSLVVDPAARRRGIGSAIVDALQGWARERGARRVYLQVEADNTAALAFYARRGCVVAHSYHYRSA